MSKTALFIQHQRLAPPAMLGDAFADAGYDNEILLVDETAVNIEFPDPHGFDVIIPLGATLSAYEPALLQTWVGAEMAMLREADRAGVPVLGVCFGGQLLAQAHGGRASRSDRPEIGWYTIESGDRGLVPRFCVLSSRADLVCSARLNPDLADRQAEVERRIGHRLRTDLTMADVIAEAPDAVQLALIPLAAIAQPPSRRARHGPHTTPVFGFASDDNEA